MTKIGISWPIDSRIVDKHVDWLVVEQVDSLAHRRLISHIHLNERELAAVL